MRTKSITLLALVFLAAVVGLYCSTNLRFETDLDAYSLITRDDGIEYDSLLVQFDSPTYNETMIVLENEALWGSRTQFLRLRTITDYWASYPALKAYSLSNLNYPRKGVFGSVNDLFLNVSDSLEFEKRFAELQEFKDITQKFLSTDRRFSLLILIPDSGSVDAGELEKFRNSPLLGDGISAHLINYDLADKALESEMRSDGSMLAIISTLLVLISFFLLTKSLKGLALIALMVGFNLGMLVLFMSLFDIGFTIHMVAIPCLVVVLSFTDIMHVLYHHRKLHSAGSRLKELRTQILHEVRLPMVLTSLSNIIGFIIFLVLAENDFLFNFALVAIVGVLIAYMSARVILIDIVAGMKPFINRTDYEGLNKWHRNVGLLILNRRKAVFVGLILTAGASAACLYQDFSIETSEAAFGAGADHVNRAASILQRDFFGEKEAEIVVDLKGKDLWSPEVLSIIDSVQSEIEQVLNPLYINSAAVVAKRYHRYTKNGMYQAFVVPEVISAATRSELMTHAHSLGGEGLVSDDSSKTRIVFGFVDGSLASRRANYKLLVDRLSHFDESGLNFQLTGKSVLADRGAYSFTVKVLIGLIIGLLGASLMVCVVLRSLRQSLGLVVVNLMHLLLVIVLMLWCDIRVSVESLFFLSILAGLCVDDSIYLVTQKQRSRTLHIFPIAVTSLVLAAGFVALGCSSFIWIRPFAWIFLVGIFLAYLMDMFVLPLFFDGNPDRERAT